MLAQSRLKQVFQFLKGLNELRNPVQRNLEGYAILLRLDTWPVHPCIVVRHGDRLDTDDDAEADMDAEMEPLIRIQRSDLTPCPEPPESLEGWLKPGWKAADIEPAVLESRNFLDEDGETATVAFLDDSKRETVLSEWVAVRKKWVIAERPAIAARQLFEKVHSLWTAIQRDSERIELVLADGMLSVPTESVRHPVLMQRVNLEFDPSVPEFRFLTGTEKVELHRALLRSVPGIAGRMIAQFDSELESQPVEPLAGESAVGYFRRLAQGLFNDGEFLDQKPATHASGRPTIWREPVLFLRPRNAGLSTTLDNIIQDLADDQTEPPKGLARIVSVETHEGERLPENGISEETRRNPQYSPPDILFSKPANAEQYQIAERLAQFSAVLVQGPPGTGKTHTIANILGSLLAQGKTVLVTAHTTKALRVPGGWVVATNLNNDLKEKIMVLATRLAGLSYGRDVESGP